MAGNSYEEKVIAEIGALTPHQYKDALLALERERLISAKQREMLRIHCNAPNHTVSPARLAGRVGFKGHGAVNLQYGRLAHLLWKVLGLPRPPARWAPPFGKWTRVLAWSQDPQGKWQPRMKPNLAKALNQMRWSGSR